MLKKCGSCLLPLTNTPFVTPDGLYHFKVLPFGVANGPSTFQSTMDIVLGGLRLTSCLVYLDDIIVYAQLLLLIWNVSS